MAIQERQEAEAGSHYSAVLKMHCSTGSFGAVLRPKSEWLKLERVQGPCEYLMQKSPLASNIVRGLARWNF